MFRLVDRPRIMPGRTIMGSTVGPVVDTQMVLPKGGCVYLSRIEVHEAARLMPEVVAELATDFGWLAAEKAAELEQRIADLERDLEDARGGDVVVVTLDDARELLADRDLAVA